MRTIDAETLRRWLDEGLPVTVLDVRQGDDRAEWSIPGSIHVDAYRALKSGDPAALAGIELSVDAPVVTVCGMGHASRVAAEQLQARGYRALSLEGGMRAWSLAWNVAEVPLAGMRARVIQVRRTGKGCLSYIVGSEGEAAVIDPSVDPDVYTRIAERNDWRITKVLDTHVHADHLSRSLPLARMTGAEVLLPRPDAGLLRLPGVAGRRRGPDRRRDARCVAHAGAFLGEHVLPARRPGPLHWGHAVPHRGGASRPGGGPRGVPGAGRCPVSFLATPARLARRDRGATGAHEPSRRLRP